MFAGSLGLVDDCGLTFLHVFPYSRREGTPAARMPQVAGPIISKRAARLRKSGEAALASYLHLQVGRVLEVLVERRGKGRTPGYAEVQLDLPAAAGDLVPVRVTRSDGACLQGEQLHPTCAP
jgi:threonylcarbamoyladenosine tRNA methylthiotransferase MtaB